VLEEDEVCALLPELILAGVVRHFGRAGLDFDALIRTKDFALFLFVTTIHAKKTDVKSFAFRSKQRLNYL